MDKSVDEELGQDIGAAVKEDADVAVGIEGCEESAHVRGEDAEQGHAAQNVNEEDALGKADRAGGLRLWLHAYPGVGNNGMSGRRGVNRQMAL